MIFKYQVMNHLVKYGPNVQKYKNVDESVTAKATSEENMIYLVCDQSTYIYSLFQFSLCEESLRSTETKIACPFLSII